MENNNQELSNIETIDFDDNNPQTNIAPDAVTESLPVVNSNVVNDPQSEQPVINNVDNPTVVENVQVEQVVSNNIVSGPSETVVNNTPVDDINTTISTDVQENPQAQVLNEIKPEEKEKKEDIKKDKKISYLPLILLFVFLMVFIFMLPTISKFFNGI